MNSLIIKSVILTLGLFLPFCLQAQKANAVIEKWSVDNKNDGATVYYYTKYEGLSGARKSVNVLIEKPKTQRPKLMIWIMTGRINEQGSINLQIGKNKAVVLAHTDGEIVLDSCYLYDKNKKQKVDVLAQLLNSKEAVISFDDAVGTAQIIKVPLADFQAIYAKLN